MPKDEGLAAQVAKYRRNPPQSGEARMDYNHGQQVLEEKRKNRESRRQNDRREATMYRPKDD